MNLPVLIPDSFKEVDLPPLIFNQQSAPRKEVKKNILLPAQFYVEKIMGYLAKKYMYIFSEELPGGQIDVGFRFISNEHGWIGKDNKTLQVKYEELFDKNILEASKNIFFSLQPYKFGGKALETVGIYLYSQIILKKKHEIINEFHRNFSEHYRFPISWRLPIRSRLIKYGISEYGHRDYRLIDHTRATSLYGTMGWDLIEHPFESNDISRLEENMRFTTGKKLIKNSPLHDEIKKNFSIFFDKYPLKEIFGKTIDDFVF